MEPLTFTLTPQASRARAFMGAVLASLLFVFAGPLPGAVADTGSAEVAMTAGAFGLVFEDTAPQIAGTVVPATPTALVPSGTVTLYGPSGGPALGSGSVETEGPFLGIYLIVDTPVLTLGTHDFLASYSGDANFAPKTIQFSLTVISGPSTQTAMALSPAGTSTFGQAVTVAVQVSAPGGPLTGTPVGSVHLLIDGVDVASVGVGAGWQATFTVSDMSVGTHAVVGEYRPDPGGDYFGSSSPPVAHTVVAALLAIRTEFHTSLHGTISLGQKVTAQAVIAPRIDGGPTPTGWVQFYDWNTKVGAPVQLVNGSAWFKYTSLKLGKHVLQAKYLGSSTYVAGFTPARTVTVVLPISS